MIDQINELPEDRLKSSPETSRYTENKWISRKNQNKLYFLHLIDILNNLLLIWYDGGKLWNKFHNAFSYKEINLIISQTEDLLKIHFLNIYT